MDPQEPPASDERWRSALQAVVDDRDLLILHAQPIVELTTGQIAGFELLSRFHGPWSAPPDVWLTAAARWGFSAVLQSRILSDGIAARAKLPPDTFLTVNLDPHLLADPDVAAVLIGQDDLSRLVLELTEHTPIDGGPTTAAVLDHVRAAGGLLAMDDVGTGYAGLSTLLSLRPAIVKLDRELICGIDRDPVKRSLVEVFGDLTARMDSWVLAEGIETRAELDVLIGLGVPLGQGFVLARPDPVLLSDLPPDIVDYIRRCAARTSLQTHIASLIRPASVGTDRAENDVLLRADGMVSQVRTVSTRADAPSGPWSPAMTVAASAGLVETARRAMSRDEAHRFAPVVCTDGAGAVLGLVAIDDLMMSLCRSTPAPTGR